MSTSTVSRYAQACIPPRATWSRKKLPVTRFPMSRPCWSGKATRTVSISPPRTSFSRPSSVRVPGMAPLSRGFAFLPNPVFSLHQQKRRGWDESCRGLVYGSARAARLRARPRGVDRARGDGDQLRLHGRPDRPALQAGARTRQRRRVRAHAGAPDLVPGLAPTGALRGVDLRPRHPLSLPARPRDDPGEEPRRGRPAALHGRARDLRHGHRAGGGGAPGVTAAGAAVPAAPAQRFGRGGIRGEGLSAWEAFGDFRLSSSGSG